MIQDNLVRGNIRKKLEDTKLVTPENGHCEIGKFDITEPDFGPTEVVEEDALLVQFDGDRKAYVKPSDIRSHVDYLLLKHFVKIYHKDYINQILLATIDNNRIMWGGPARAETGGNFVDSSTVQREYLPGVKTLRRIKKEYK
jgi:hypothetical protein